MTKLNAMKKTIFLLLSLQLVFSITYAVGWQKLYFPGCTQTYDPYWDESYTGIFPTNDGGCMLQAPFSLTNTYSAIDRYDKNGNLIWDHKAFYTIGSLDSSFYYGGVVYALQLPNNNIVL